MSCFGCESGWDRRLSDGFRNRSYGFRRCYTRIVYSVTTKLEHYPITRFSLTIPMRPNSEYLRLWRFFPLSFQSRQWCHKMSTAPGLMCNISLPSCKRNQPFTIRYIIQIGSLWIPDWLRILCANLPSQKARGVSYNLLLLLIKKPLVLSSVRVLRTAVPFDQSGIHKEPPNFIVPAR